MNMPIYKHSYIKLSKYTFSYYYLQKVKAYKVIYTDLWDSNSIWNYVELIQSVFKTNGAYI